MSTERTFTEHRDLDAAITRLQKLRERLTDAVAGVSGLLDALEVDLLDAVVISESLAVSSQEESQRQEDRIEELEYANEQRLVERAGEVNHG